MRTKDSLFNRVCEFINTKTPGAIYKSSELTDFCKGYENVTSYKRWNKNPFERTRKYQTMLKYSGIVTNVKRGYWKVEINVPDWFTLSHANIMCGYTHSTRSKKKDGEWVYSTYRRVNMTKEEIRDTLSLYTATQPVMDKVAVIEIDSTHFINADPMFYASGAYTKEKEITNTNQFMNNSSKAAFYSEHPYPTAKAEKITREESEFFKTDDSIKERNQLVENLRESIGLLEAATVIMDKVQILDPLVQGRVVNIYEQLKALTETVGSRIEYNRTKQII
jgi:hypothetical protein